MMKFPVIFIIMQYHIILSTKLSITGTYAQRKILYVAPNQILTNIEFDLTQ